ncbi:DUF4251 domain-containing protein [Tenacibaculum sp. IB213877]|nr:DUF4251 domain-containing protein [Tenacibaculum sp. IB213877]MDY0779506.1 DUF4251 domain-containing protein [Tenacibaculum sp. IB213877]
MKNIVFLFFIVVVTSCASKKEITPQQQAAFDNIMNSKSYKIESSWAYPRASNALMSLQNARLFPLGSTAGMIDITGNTNYLIIKNDSVSGYLPYFGERQMGGYSNSNKIGIEFNGQPKDYQITKTDKGNYTITFSAKDDNSNSESYRVTVRIFPNLTTSIHITSSHRTSIEYRGKLQEYIEKDKT